MIKKVSQKNIQSITSLLEREDTRYFIQRLVNQASNSLIYDLTNAFDDIFFLYKLKYIDGFWYHLQDLDNLSSISIDIKNAENEITNRYHLIYDLINNNYIYLNPQKSNYHPNNNYTYTNPPGANYRPNDANFKTEGRWMKEQVSPEVLYILEETKETKVTISDKLIKYVKQLEEDDEFEKDDAKEKNKTQRWAVWGAYFILLIANLGDPFIDHYLIPDKTKVNKEHYESHSEGSDGYFSVVPSAEKSDTIFY